MKEKLNKENCVQEIMNQKDNIKKKKDDLTRLPGNQEKNKNDYHSLNEKLKKRGQVDITAVVAETSFEIYNKVTPIMEQNYNLRAKSYRPKDKLNCPVEDQIQKVDEIEIDAKPADVSYIYYNK